MKRDRVRLAARMAAIEAFREERERQGLASARLELDRTCQDVARAEHALADIEQRRALALGTRHDVGTWLLYGEIADAAAGERDTAIDLQDAAAIVEGQARQRWADAKATATSTDDRATRLSNLHLTEVAARDASDRIDLWLARRGESA
ncbi:MULTISPECIES: hypothetical protein [unclassified Luteibacter]|uniref:hypothetical protein n=1 Tax=Luteibacter sp. PvP019 TaxID=3156436 RepID=UPI0033908309